MTGLDRTILSTALMGFAAFIIVHILLFRLWRTEGVGGILLTSLLTGMGVDLVGIASYGVRAPHAFFVLSVSVAIYGMLFFTYMNLVFGMGEAAIRIRLLRELYHRPARKATLQDLYRTYNADVILHVRLDRLVKGGHLTMEEGTYVVKNRLILRCADLLLIFRAILHPPRSKIS